MRSITATIFMLLSFSLITTCYAQNATNTEKVPGSNFLLRGYGFTNFSKVEDQNSNFTSGFNPIFLYKFGDKIFFEGEVEFEYEDGVTNIDLEYAQIFYSFNDYVMVGMGRFLSPLNYFGDKIHPAWINKLPDNPFAVSGHGGLPLTAMTQLGVQIKGGIPVGSSKFTYTVYVSNGPTLNTDITATPAEEGGLPTFNKFNGIQSVKSGGHEGSAPEGSLGYSNFEDNNSNKAIGGRIGIFLTSDLEIGYGFERAKVGTDNSVLADVFENNHAFDLSYVTDVPALKGRIDLKGQWLILNIDNPNVNDLDFENDSNGGYGQIAYQPYDIDNEFFKNFEFVFRYDKLDLPDGYLSFDKERYSYGINYWLSSSSLFKVAYERLTQSDPDGEELSNDKFIAQFAFGF